MFLLACLVSAAMTTPSFSGSAALDAAVELAIRERRIPGAVLIVGHDGHIVHRKAYGNRSEVPAVEPMTLDTIFDCASLTKVVATTSCLMKLFEEGKYRLGDKVTDYIPEFQGGQSPITLRNLMTHFSGLRPDVPLKPDWSGYDTGIHLACTDPPMAPPNTRHVYSDINFELLGELVHRTSGQTLAAFAREHIFLPLGMKDSMYQPPVSLVPRIAPTEADPKTGQILRGVVHDPTARNMGGIAGHAGLFSTGDDLARFCQMMLNKGVLGPTRLFSPLTVQKFTDPQTPIDQPVLRGLGWDIDSPYSGNRGELFPIGSYGHTGFTGTSIWIDPSSKTYVILLTNAVHNGPRPPMLALRSKVATITAAALGITSRRVILNGYNDTIDYVGRRRVVEHQGAVLTGLDVLEASHFEPFAGKRIGLITNQTGLDRHGKRNVDLMVAAGVKVAKLFSPEHGWAGAVDHEGITDTVDAATGIPVLSLYGKTLRPTPEMLEGLDALVFDIQDIGVRFYTYESTMAYAMEAAAKAHLPFYVLDRPNPITGVRVEGPPMDEANTSFVGYLAAMPVRHGMTVGELAGLFNAERRLGVDLHVVKMHDWDRGDWLDSTNQPWVNPSPNIRSLNAASLYPGLCLIEYAPNISVGRGTDSPFEQIGAEFIDGPKLSAYLNRRGIPGIRTYPTTFTPNAAKLEGKPVQGVRFVITDRENMDAVKIGLEVAVALERLYPGKVDIEAGKKLIGSNDVIRQIQSAEDPEDIQDSYRDALKKFEAVRAKYLLYK
ncbi:MAG: DUF1343 domain-containing protein [Fimbriimonas sp.]|nr:DUF1343 domain-containing protein [Fimbriimonas sp.]